MDRRSFLKGAGALLSSFVAIKAMPEQYRTFIPKGTPILKRRPKNLAEVARADFEKRLSPEAVAEFDAEVKKAYNARDTLAGLVGKRLGRREDQIIIDALLKG